MCKTCLICTLSIKIKHLYTIKCNHNYHKKCLQPWIKINPICPYCSHIITSTFKVELINPDNTYKAICIISRERLLITSKKNSVILDITLSNIKNCSLNIKRNILTLIYFINGTESVLLLKGRSKVMLILFNMFRAVFVS